jgi:hypothetical protein
VAKVRLGVNIVYWSGYVEGVFSHLTISNLWSGSETNGKIRK